MDIFRVSEREEGLSAEEIRQALLQALEGRAAKKVLIIPPDFTRYHSNAGLISNILYHELTERGAEVDLLPALGTHAPMTEEQIRDFDQRLLQGLKKFRREYIREEMSDFEKEVAIHDYLINTVTYDTESIEDYNLEKKHKEIYNTLGPLLRKKAVCWGIACAFKLICDFCRIKCFVVVGNLRSENDGEGHAWNIVRLQDENYHVDVTWDLRTSDTISFAYDYLNLNDHLIKLDHFWDDIVYPSCNSLEYNYHHRYKLYVSSPRLYTSSYSREL